MTADKNRLSAWLQNLGFVEDPFGHPRAERSPGEMLQQTYVYDEALEQLMLDEYQSAVFLAPYGGGKTAARRYTQFRWEDERTDTLVVVYKDFATVAKSLPDCRLEDHIVPLMQAIVAAVWQRFDRESDRYKQLFEPNQVWWLKMFAAFSPAGLESLLSENIFLAEDISDSEAYKQLQSLRDKRPFNKNASLSSMLKKVVDECKLLRFDKVLILVDEVDDYTENNELVDMQNLLRPLFRAMSTYEHILWKFFVPDELQSFVMNSPARRRRAVTVQTIRWDEDRLKKFLEQRLLWASEDGIKSLNEMREDDQVFALTKLDEEIVDLVWESRIYQEEMGIPRTLLNLGNRLVQLVQKKKEPLITKAVWDEFTDLATDNIN